VEESAYREKVREIARAAGVGENQLLQALGLLYLIKEGILPAPGGAKPAEGGLIPARASDAEKRVMHILSIERTIGLDEILEYMPDAEKAVERLIKSGRAYEAVNPYGVRIIAIADDGTLDISSLSEEERRRLIINTYANRSKGLSYAKMLELMRSAEAKRGERAAGGGPSRREQVIEALKGGPKSLRELEGAGIPGGALRWTIGRLLKRGVVKRVGAGVYALASAQS